MKIWDRWKYGYIKNDYKGKVVHFNISNEQYIMTGDKLMGWSIQSR